MCCRPDSPHQACLESQVQVGAVTLDPVVDRPILLDRTPDRGLENTDDLGVQAPAFLGGPLLESGMLRMVSFTDMTGVYIRVTK